MKNLIHFFAAGFVVAAFHAGNAWSFCSPGDIDPGSNGIKPGQAGLGVYFNVDAEGTRNHVQWARHGGGVGFHAPGRRGSGLVDSGAELFGVGTPMVLEGRSAPNGFVGLAQYDARQLGGNDDGLITEADAIWPQVRIWLDLDADGVSTAGEMRSLRSYRITALETIPRIRKYVDEAGHIIPYWVWATQRTNPKRARVVDIFFLVLP